MHTNQELIKNKEIRNKNESGNTAKIKKEEQMEKEEKGLISVITSK